MKGQFNGKYRGTVTDVSDPLNIGRIRARVPDVYQSDESGWAMPCFPFTGDGMGFCGLPKVGAGVWIEFEQGDPETPVWSGGWFGSSSEVPGSALSAPYKKTIIKTAGGMSILLDDTSGSGGITIEVSGGPKIKLTSSKIEIDNGGGAKVELSGSQVSVNSGALEVS